MSFLDHIARCNNADLSQFEPWYVGDTRAGFLHRDFLPTIAVRPDLFSHRDGGWYLDAALDTPAKRTAAIRAFLLELARARPVRPTVARGALQGQHALQRAPPARDGARGGAVVRRARLRAAHDRLREEARRTAHLGAAPLLRQADVPRRARQHRRGRPAGEHRHLREPDQGMRRGGRDPARPRRAGQGRLLHRLLESIRPAAQARRHDLLRSRTAGGFHTDCT